MRLGLTLTPRLRLECTVCKRYLDPAQAKEDLLEAALFGCAAYAICCSCGQRAPSRHDRNYRQRFRRWLTRRTS